MRRRAAGGGSGTGGGWTAAGADGGAASHGETQTSSAFERTEPARVALSACQPASSNRTAASPCASVVAPATCAPGTARYRAPLSSARHSRTSTVNGHPGSARCGPVRSSTEPALP
jgi:hypothetical protein